MQRVVKFLDTIERNLQNVTLSICHSINQEDTGLFTSIETRSQNKKNMVKKIVTRKKQLTQVFIHTTSQLGRDDIVAVFLRSFETLMDEYKENLYLGT